MFRRCGIVRYNRNSIGRLKISVLGLITLVQYTEFGHNFVNWRKIMFFFNLSTITVITILRTKENDDKKRRLRLIKLVIL